MKWTLRPLDLRCGRPCPQRWPEASPSSLQLLFQASDILPMAQRNSYLDTSPFFPPILYLFFPSHFVFVLPFCSFLPPSFLSLCFTRFCPFLFWFFCLCFFSCFFTFFSSLCFSFLFYLFTLYCFFVLLCVFISFLLFIGFFVHSVCSFVFFYYVCIYVESVSSHCRQRNTKGTYKHKKAIRFWKHWCTQFLQLRPTTSCPTYSSPTKSFSFPEESFKAYNVNLLINKLPNWFPLLQWSHCTPHPHFVLCTLDYLPLYALSLWYILRAYKLLSFAYKLCTYKTLRKHPLSFRRGGCSESYNILLIHTLYLHYNPS